MDDEIEPVSARSRTAESQPAVLQAAALQEIVTACIRGAIPEIVSQVRRGGGGLQDPGPGPGRGFVKRVILRRIVFLIREVELEAIACSIRLAAAATYDAKAALATKYPFINDRLALTDGDRDAVGKQLQAAAKSLTSFEEQLTELEVVPNTTEAFTQTLLITCKLQAALESIHEVERLTSEIASLEQQHNEANAQLAEATKALVKHAEALSEEKERVQAIEAELKAERQRFIEKYAKVKRDLSNAEDELHKTRRRSEPSSEALTSRFMDFLKTLENPNKRARSTDN
ncbi:hypothetical protein PLESTB_001407600 [Pleodorina starrii]|uniref:Uncharacterized protein n=1 Tax=Pleodorina starrii TaxID=330485 RepID=A0A9W6BVJ3_9CHLO|nr:hypothetical protein PLESTB_001407500 [Pleodorina starrii]GLC58848.1 hypothetical protein PLESTB_001407600 [Pleodorina starrii]GLC68029.1 hypothetical protein PLESTF_000637300 [Pleodorina starrii]GLC68030.1 hypothetical protein PLESTF_000637400 [Pleodorina starrii]